MRMGYVDDGSGAYVYAPIPDEPEAAGTAALAAVADTLPEIEQVRAALDAAGIEYDKRLGLAKLKALLPQ